MRLSRKNLLSMTLWLRITVLALSGMASAASAASPWADLADPILEKLDTSALPQPDVVSLAQDSTGFLWIGTNGGLARFDGRHYKVFHPDPNNPHALQDGGIRALLPEPNGGLWIGTKSSGLAYYDPVTGHFRRHPMSQSDRAQGASIWALAPAPDDELWVGSHHGLTRFSPKSNRFTPIRLTTTDRQPLVRKILSQTRNGAVWIGTDNGLFYRGKNDTVFSQIEVPGLTTDAKVFSLAEDSEGKIWIGTVNIVVALDAQRRLISTYRNDRSKPDSLAPGSQLAILPIGPDALWIASSQDGLTIVDTKRGKTRRLSPDRAHPSGLKAGAVRALLRDRSGLVWIANGFGGLLRHNPETPGVLTLTNGDIRSGPGGESQTALAFDKSGRLWVGDEKGTLVALSPDRGRVMQLVPHPDSPVNALALTEAGALLIGTARGLCRIEAGQASVKCASRPPELARTPIWAILPDEDRIWLGSRLGLMHANEKEQRVSLFQHGDSPDSLSNNFVNALMLDRRRQLWVGTMGGGINRYAPETGSNQRFMHDPGNAQSLGPGSISAILEDRRGRIWIGAIGGPLNILEQRQDDSISVRKLGLRDGMPNENVGALAEDAQGRIWASTANGLALIDPEHLSIRRLGLADGVAIKTYVGGSMARSPDGAIFFGGIGGITMLQPEAIGNWTFDAPLAITEIRIGRSPVPEGSVRGGVITPVKLEPGERNLSIEFAALDLSAPELNRYQYRLEGFDREWNHADSARPRAGYTNLPPGEFVLRLRGTNRAGVWSSHEIVLPVTVAPAWHETWWFRSAALMLLLSAIYAWNVRRIRRLKRQHELENLALRAKAELETAAAQQRFISLVSHEMRNPLAIMDVTLKNIRRIGADMPPAVTDRLQKIERAYRRVQALVDNYLTAETMRSRELNPRKQEINFKRLLEEVIADIRSAAPLHRIELVAPRSLPALFADREMLYLVISNLVDNAVKYSPKGGSIVLTASSTDEFIDLTVQDNGIGIAASDLPHIFEAHFRADHGHADIKGFGLGLHLVRQMVELHGGTITAESEVGSGATFKIRLPLHQP